MTEQREEPCKLVHRNPDVYWVAVPDDRYLNPAGTNCFIVRDGEDTLVVDVGAASAEGERLVREALAFTEARSERTACFLTHFHVDHTEQVESLFLEGATVYGGTEEFELMRALRDETTLPTLVARLAAEGVPADELVEYRDFRLGVADFDDTRYHTICVDEGDEINVGQTSFAVVNTSGHAPGHRSLFHKESGLLIGGDQVLFTASPYIPLYPEPEDRLALYLDGLRHVRDLGVKCLLQSHGRLRGEMNRDVFPGRVDWLIAHREKRVRGFQDLVVERPGLSGFEIVQTAPSSMPIEDWWAASLVLRWVILANGLAILDHLVSEGRLTRQTDSRGIHRYWAASLND